MLVNGARVSVVGELHPRWRLGYGLPSAPVLFELDLAAVLQRPVPQSRPVSKLQPVERDLAVIVADAVSHDAVLQAARAGAKASAGGELLRDITLFDVYRPKQASAAMAMGEKSLALRLSLQSDSATLTEEQIDQAVAAVLQGLSTGVSARLRA